MSRNPALVEIVFSIRYQDLTPPLPSMSCSFSLHESYRTTTARFRYQDIQSPRPIYKQCQDTRWPDHCQQPGVLALETHNDAMSFGEPEPLSRWRTHSDVSKRVFRGSFLVRYHYVACPHPTHASKTNSEAILTVRNAECRSPRWPTRLRCSQRRIEIHSWKIAELAPRIELWAFQLQLPSRGLPNSHLSKKLTIPISPRLLLLDVGPRLLQLVN